MRLLILLLIALSLLTPALADEQSEKWALAAEIVGITTTDAIVESTSDAIWPGIEANLRARNPNVPDGLFDELEVIFREINAEGVKQLSAVIIGFYVREFTLAQLQELRGFYDSDAGKKLVELQPKMVETIMPVMMAQIQQLVPQVIERLPETAKKRGLNVSA